MCNQKHVSFFLWTSSQRYDVSSQNPPRLLDDDDEICKIFLKITSEENTQTLKTNPNTHTHTHLIVWKMCKLNWSLINHHRQSSVCISYYFSLLFRVSFSIFCASSWKNIFGISYSCALSTSYYISFFVLFCFLFPCNSFLILQFLRLPDNTHEWDGWWMLFFMYLDCLK